MNAYGKVAVAAVELYQRGSAATPREAWELAAESQFKSAPESRKKGCPRNAFLGLCEAGLVRGVPPGSYTSSSRNKAYALTAGELLASAAPLPTPGALWESVIGVDRKQHNGQMDVVLALHREQLLLR